MGGKKRVVGDGGDGAPTGQHKEFDILSLGDGERLRGRTEDPTWWIDTLIVSVWLLCSEETAGGVGGSRETG